MILCVLVFRVLCSVFRVLCSEFCVLVFRDLCFCDYLCVLVFLDSWSQGPRTPQLLTSGQVGDWHAFCQGAPRFHQDIPRFCTFLPGIPCFYQGIPRFCTVSFKVGPWKAQCYSCSIVSRRQGHHGGQVNNSWWALGPDHKLSVTYRKKM